MSWREFEARRLLLAEERFGSLLRQKVREEDRARAASLRALEADLAQERRRLGEES